MITRWPFAPFDALHDELFSSASLADRQEPPQRSNGNMRKMIGQCFSPYPGSGVHLMTFCDCCKTLISK
jgi:hypothetical protein